MSPLFARWDAALAELKRLGRHRSFAGPAGVDFTSNDYLGYAAGRVPPGWAPGTDNGAPLSRSGGGSRLLRGHHPVWDRVEADLAAWHRADAVLAMTSGFAAVEGLIATVCEPGDWVAHDELCHACVADGLRLARCRRAAFRHNDVGHLEDLLRAEAARNEPGRERFVVTESLFSMDGDLAPLAAIAALADRYGAHLIVDEAHSTGCYGDAGSGLVDAAGIRDRVLASVHTGGKALGVAGAYVAGPRLLVDYLTNRCRHLIFTTALPPEVGRWWLDAIPRVRADAAGRQALRDNAASLRAALAGLRVAGTEYVVPVVLGDDPAAVRAAAAVREAGFDVRAIRPPTVPPGTARVRISVHADHTAGQLAGLAAAVRDAAR